ncbi:MAG: TonB-dependent receptor [Cytophagales bacterium]|nr:TonB-dependent receptor [Cytophagales bacterium]
MKKIFTISICMCALLAGAQNTQTIRGKVTDKESKYQLIGVTVAVPDTDPLIATATDENGEFVLTNVPLGRRVLKLSYVGYKDITMPNIMVTAGKQTIVNFAMEENVTQLEDVVVKAENDKTATNNEMAVISARSFNLEEAMRYAGALNDPSRMAMNYAGVSSSSDDRNDIVIRGNSPTGLLWRLDGIEIPNPNHFGLQGTTGGPVSILNTNQLDKSDFLTGAFPANYGNATSGVFDLQMRSGNNKKREYLGQIGFNGFELGAEGPFSKKYNGSYMINYRYSTLGIFKAIGVDFGTGAAIPQYQDINMKIDLPTAKLGRFQIFALGGDSYIELLNSGLSAEDFSKNTNFYGDPIRDGYFGSKMGVVGISNTYFFNPTTSQKIIFAVSGWQSNYQQDSLRYDNIEKRVFFERREFETDYLQTRMSLNYSVNKKFNAKNTLNSGINIDRLGFAYEDRTIMGAPYGIWKNRINETGADYLLQAWTQLKHNFSERLSMNAGLHYQYFTLNGQSAVEPRLGMRFRVTEKIAINLGAGVHNQTQSLMTYYTKSSYQDAGGAIIYQYMNKNLKYLNSNHIVLGTDYNFAPNWRFKGELYYQYLTNVPVKSYSSPYSILNAGATFDPPVVDSLVSNGTGYNYGTELTLEKFFGRGFYTLLTTSIYDSKYKGSDGVERNTAFNGRFIVNLLAGYEIKIGKKNTLSADLKLTYAGGRRYTPYDLAQSKLNNEFYYDYNRAWEGQYADYFRPDIKIAFRRDGKKVSQQWALQINNVLNSKNIFAERWNSISRESITVNQLGMLIIPQYRILF